MSPHSASTTVDHRYRDDGLWHVTNAQSNQEIRLALVEALEELRAIRRMNQEDGFEMQGRCAYWEAKFTKVTNQIIDFYVICACCLDLEVPYRGIWNVCDRIRECLTPEQQYQDDYIADPESSDVEVLPDEGKPRNTTTPTGRNDDARYCS
ncbi:hypothetical protein QFC20_001979 [Naganishia adeliensis]|uniref:Uncharacterized protein n=1 Tax=Naganishia adeliensis TaxID=92952 RepID=A0ACC2WN71_9TREE|nr:hypothetical protein QFC20_001979 [Naganishia adeliensis]